MPNRILREGILTSPRIAKLGWPEEVFYRRLMSVVDDFGRYYGDPGLVRAACYPRLLNKVSDSDIGKWLQVIAAAGLVRVYPAQDGESYLQLLDFRQQTRAQKSKYPDPLSDCVAIAAQAQIDCAAHAHVFGDEGVDVVATPKAPKGADGRFEEFWKAYPAKVGKDAARRAFDKRKVSSEVLTQMLRAIALQRENPKWVKDGGQFIPNPATWLNQGRWQDGADGDGSGEQGEWHETRKGVEARATQLGLPRWDEQEQWLFYKTRVVQAAQREAA